MISGRDDITVRMLCWPTAINTMTHLFYTRVLLICAGATLLCKQFFLHTFVVNIKRHKMG